MSAQRVSRHVGWVFAQDRESLTSFCASREPGHSQSVKDPHWFF